MPILENKAFETAVWASKEQERKKRKGNPEQKERRE